MAAVVLPANLPAELAPYAPTAAAPWDLRRAAHLYRRAGFGPTLPELDAAVAAGCPAAVDALLDYAGRPNRVDDLLQLVQRELVDFGEDLGTPQAFWLYRMIVGDHPFEEKLALYWHNHFATANYKVKSPAAMYRHYEMLRRHQLGRFDDLLLAVARDPAMLIWLDNDSNRRGQPNENFARELLELFTLGVGHYTEADIKEAARAFTGWRLGGDGFYFDQGQHDGGTKTFLGETGKLGGEDIIRLVAAQPQTGRYLARRLLRAFVMDDPPAAAVDGLAVVYQANDHRLDALYRVLFRSQLFFGPAAYRALVRSPIEVVVGTIRILDAGSNRRISAPALARMGQELLNPPSVKGWDGGDAWINSVTVLERMNFVNELMIRAPVRVDGRDHLLLQTLKERNLREPAAVVDFLVRYLAQDDCSAAQRRVLVDYFAAEVAKLQQPGQTESWDYKLRRLAYLVMCLPACQLS